MASTVRESLFVVLDASKTMEPAIPTVLNSLNEHLVSYTAKFRRFCLIVYNSPSDAHVVIPSQDLDVPTLKKIKRLQIDVGNEYQPHQFISALTFLKREMSKDLKHNNEFSKVILISNKEDLFTEEKEFSVIKTLLQDITELRAAVVPVLISQNSTFNIAKWKRFRYCPMVMTPEEENAVPLVKLHGYTIDELHGILNRVFYAEKAPRFHRGKIHISDLEIGVVYSNVLTIRSINAVNAYFEADPPEIPQPVKKWMNANTGKLLELNEDQENKIERHLVLPKIIEKISGEGSINIPLLGEADESTVAFRKFTILRFTKSPPPTEVRSTSLFIGPSDSVLLNSTKAFNSLHRMMKKQQVIAHVLMESNTKPVWGALYADLESSESSPSNSKIEIPVKCGFLFVPIPYMDNYRDIPQCIATKSEVTDGSKFSNLAPLMDKLVTKFKLGTGFDPNRFEDPRFAQKINILEHIALGTEIPTKEVNGVRFPLEVLDKTTPRYEKIQKNLFQTLESINGILNLKDMKIEIANSELTEPKQKRLKIEQPEHVLEPGSNADALTRSNNAADIKTEVDDKNSDEELKTALRYWKSGELSKLRVVDLKRLLQKLLGRNINGKKDELINTLEITLRNLSHT